MMSRRDAHNLCGGDEKRHHIGRHLQEPDAAIGAARNRCDIAIVSQGEPCHDTAGGDTVYRVRSGREQMLPSGLAQIEVMPSFACSAV